MSEEAFERLAEQVWHLTKASAWSELAESTRERFRSTLRPCAQVFLQVHL